MIIGLILSFFIFASIIPLIQSIIFLNDTDTESRGRGVFSYTWTVLGIIYILTSISGVCVWQDTETYVFSTLGTFLGFYLIISVRLFKIGISTGNKLISSLSWIGISVLGLFAPIPLLLFCSIPLRLPYYLSSKQMTLMEVLNKESELILVSGWTFFSLIFCICSARFMKKIKKIDMLKESQARKVDKRKLPKFKISSSGHKALDRIN